ncbi:MAG: hypothetical protein J6C76_06235, partial [Oscillospiraceae bacterium]|nr:hypothetical protein [Oscillospiraceae bacterium]
DNLDIRIDIEQFCLRMCSAARSFYNDYHTQKDFSLYNTPVLDFIATTQPQAADPTDANGKNADCPCSTQADKADSDSPDSTGKSLWRRIFGK